jgi:SAM-dependent methyltransferase
MKSAWLSTELEIYEKHVELETVGQAAAIRTAIQNAVEEYAPGNFLYLGCAGGNGLDALAGTRVLGLDLNEGYLEVARKRYGQISGMHFEQWDLNRGLPPGAIFELAFGALVFEYIEDLTGLMRGLSKRINGQLVALILATRENAPAVAESPYREALQPVGSEFRYLSVEGFVELAVECGFVLERREEIPLPAGKHFVSITLKRRL